MRSLFGRFRWFALSLSGLLVAVNVSAAGMVGKQAPTFSLVDEAGKSHNLESYRGKTVVLEWTNPQCPFVVRHYDAGTMKRLAEATAGDGVVWLAVNSSHFTSSKETKAWASKYGHTFPTLQDPSGKVGKAYGAKTTPHMFVIDGAGVVRYDGAIDSDPWVKEKSSENYVRAAIMDLKAKRPVGKDSVKPYGCSVKYKR